VGTSGVAGGGLDCAIATQLVASIAHSTHAPAFRIIFCISIESFCPMAKSQSRFSNNHAKALLHESAQKM
jgi:hypothetical protein